MPHAKALWYGAYEGLMTRSEGMRCVSLLSAMPILPRCMLRLLDAIVSARALWGGPRVRSDSAQWHMVGWFQ